MPDSTNAAELRRLAMKYAASASRDSCPPEERARLMLMREALLSLAIDADWLTGRMVPTIAASR